MRTFPKARLIVSATLFLGWLGYLAYLVATSRDPIVVSRPQALVSSALLLVEVREENGRPAAKVTVREVRRPKAVEPKGELTLADLPFHDRAQGYRGPGLYLVPVLRREQGGQPIYEVTPLPLSPGFSPHFVTVTLEQPAAKKEELVELIRTTFPVRAALAADLVDSAAKSPQLLAKNVNDKTALDFRLAAEKLGARLLLVNQRFPAEETRIYLATPDVLRQVDNLP